MMKKKQILLLEDCQSYREVVALGLGKEPSFHVCSEFNTVDGTLEYLRENSLPDLILLDLNLPGLNGLKAIPDFREQAPETKILVLTESDKEADILKAITLGASGYLLKDSPLRRIINGIT